MKKLYLTRHGQTDWNVQRKVCGRTEAHLTDLGRQQAAGWPNRWRRPA